MHVLYLFLACRPGTPDAGDDGEPDGGDGEEADGPSPYEMPDRSGCDYDVAYDDGADGSVDVTGHYEYDDADRVHVYDYEDSNTGAWSTWAATYDDNDCALTISYASVDEDGEIGDYEVLATCDEHGNRTRWEVEMFIGDPDDPDEWLWVYEYANTYDGDLLVQVDSTITVDLSGTEYTWWEHDYMDYGSDGLVSHHENWEEWEKGKPALSWTEDWTWQDADRPLTRDYEDVEEGITETETWRYDSHGRAVQDDEQIAEEPPERREYTWDDSAYRLTSSSLDVGADGVVEGATTFDCEGDWPWSCEVAIDGDTDGEGEEPYDGVVDHAGSTAWTCP
jgi:hypothetical protein